MELKKGMRLKNKFTEKIDTIKGFDDTFLNTENGRIVIFESGFRVNERWMDRWEIIENLF